MTTQPPPVIVWGNCQAAPLASLLTEPLAAHGWGVIPVPAVFEVDESDLAAIQDDVLPRAAVLITQPIRDEYRIPGCGSDQLAARLPPDAPVVTIPVTYDTSGFPYQVNAHLGDGTRVDAPITDYHDLRTIVAAERGLTVDQTLDWWPAPTAAMVTTNAEASRAELQRRETDLDVHASDLLAGPAMFTLSHPTNAVLGEIARRILAELDLPGDIQIPEREFLGARRAPVEAVVVDTLGWPDDARRDTWVVNQTALDPAAVIGAHLDFYAEHPDLITDTRRRFAARLELLDL